MSAIGQLISYVIGSIDTVRIFGTFFGDTQFKQMTVIAALSLIGAVGVTSYSVKERVLITARLVPFPLLQYHMGRRDLLPVRSAQGGSIKGNRYARRSRSCRQSVADSILGNYLPELRPATILHTTTRYQAHALHTPTTTRSGSSPQSHNCSPTRPPNSLADIADHVRRDHDLRAISPLSRVRNLPCRSLRHTWAISGWAPFAFMGVEINKLTMNTNGATGSTTRSGVTMITSASMRSSAADTELEVLRLNHRDSDGDDTDEEDQASNIPSTGELAGIYLGVLNVYTTLPQFVGTFISWIVFTILEPGAEPNKESDASDTNWMNLDKDKPNAIAICLFIGAISALVAAEATRRLRYVR
ncbi:hypothetical protein N7526_010668 [Penicillium atrosanguineum]|nr:hypothetical protein N7526_010668 [Penicillium atrosanguineum]